MTARIAVGVSGGGRSLANFLKLQQGFEVAAVFASRPDCKAVEVALAAGLTPFIGDFSAGARAATGASLYAWLEKERIDWIALAGFLKVLPLSPAFKGRTINIHPALLPDFGGAGMYGDRVHAAVLKAGRKESGATVHHVTERYDEGGIIAQERVPVLPGDDVHTLADRVFAAECRLYPRVLRELTHA